ncbi:MULTISPECIES: hypothetical protein [Cupriavidus]
MNQAGEGAAKTAQEANDVQAEALPGADAAAPADSGDEAPKAGPIKVHVVDDELAGLTFAHLAALTGDFTQALADISSPEVAEMWPIVVAIDSGFKGLESEKPETVLQYLGSTKFVQDVLLSQHFREHAPQSLQEPLAPFLHRADAVNTLKAQIEGAFPPTEFETTFASARPSVPAELLQYDFLILDLVLHKSTGAVDEMVDYLFKMGEVDYPQQLPAIIVMSNNEEITTERLRFSTESQISAAGLLLLPKARIREADFGKLGLILSYQQLDRQRHVAQHMRVFMRTWMKALDEARSRAGTTLWNLDAAAMQQIHLSAAAEDDPYDEHLNELMSREYLWHVESSPAVGDALEALDSCFMAQFLAGSSPPVIGTRFIAPLVNAKVARDFVSHYTWTGFAVPPEVSSVQPEEALKRFNRLVPFGAVLAPEDLTPETECLVHITQQCDLNAATRPDNLSNPVQSTQFAVVLPVEVVEHRMPEHKNDSLVARSLTIGGKEYDFKLAKGRQLALPIPQFIEYANERKLRVVGRLRHDIASHFLSATANHMTRFASLKTTRVEVRNAHVLLYGSQLPPGGAPMMLRDGEGNPVSVQVAKHEKLFFFQDNTSMRLALWLKEQLGSHYPAVDIDASRVCNSLSVGLRDKQGLIKIVDFVVKSFDIGELAGNLAAAQAPAQRVHLVVVTPPQEAE